MPLKAEDLNKLAGNYQQWKQKQIAKAQGEAQISEEKGLTTPEGET